MEKNRCLRFIFASQEGLDYVNYYKNLPNQMIGTVIQSAMIFRFVQQILNKKLLPLNRDFRFVGNTSLRAAFHWIAYE